MYNYKWDYLKLETYLNHGGNLPTKTTTTNLSWLSIKVLRNIFRNNIDEELTVVRKTERDNETYKFVCFLT